MSDPAPPSPPRSRLREWLALDRRIWLLAGVRAVNTMGLSLVMTFLAIYFTRDRGVAPAALGLFYAGSNVGQAFAQGWAGELSDRTGRRPLMVWALLARAALLFLVGALIVAGASVVAIAVAVFVSAVLRGCFEPVAYAVVADVARAEDRVAAFGLQKVGVNAGWALGPLFGGLLVEHIGFGYVFFCAAPVVLVSAIAVARIHEPPRAAQPPAAPFAFGAAWQAIRGRPDVSLFLACALAGAFVHTQLFSTFQLHADNIGFSESAIGRFYFINGTLVVALQLTGVSIIDRIGATRALVLSPLLYVGGYLWFGASDAWLGTALAMSVVTSGEVLQSPAVQSMTASLGDPQRMGRAFGVLGTMQMLGVAIAPAVGMAAFDLYRGQPLILWAIFASVSAALSVGYVAFAVLHRRALKNAT